MSPGRPASRGTAAASAAAARAGGGSTLTLTGRPRKLHPVEIAQVVAKIRSKFAAESMATGRQDWNALFRRLDKNHDGTLDFAEVRGMFRRVLKITKADISDDQIQVLFEELDSDRSGELSLDELRWLLADASPDEIASHIERKWNKKGSAQKEEASVEDTGPTQEELDTALELFQMFDEDYSGTIDSEEMIHCLQGLGFNPSRADCSAIMTTVPSEGADFDTFVKVARAQAEVLHHEDDDKALIEAFKLFDTDNRGWLSITEIRYIMKTYGEPLSEEELEDMVKRLDDDGDGIITFEEAVNGRLFTNDPLEEIRPSGKFLAPR